MPIYRYIDRLIPSCARGGARRRTTELCSARMEVVVRRADICRILCTIACTPFHSFFVELFLIDEGASASMSFTRARLAVDTTRLRDDSFYLLNLSPPPPSPSLCSSARISHFTFEFKGAPAHSNAFFKY